MPEKIISRAKDILNDFECKNNKDDDISIKEKYDKIKSFLSTIDVKNIDPNEAWVRLFEIKDIITQDK